MSAQKSPGRPWPFLSPHLVTFHCSELWPAHVGVRENWLCWAGTTSCPQLVPPGSPQFRVSAQLPSLLQVGPGVPRHSGVGAPQHSPSWLSQPQPLDSCGPKSLGSPPSSCTLLCAKGELPLAANMSPCLGVTPSTLLMLGSIQLWTWHWLYHIFYLWANPGEFAAPSLGPWQAGVQ